MKAAVFALESLDNLLLNLFVAHLHAVRHQHIKDQIDLLSTIKHPEIMHIVFRVDFRQRVDDDLTHLVHPLVIRYNWVKVHEHCDAEFCTNLPLCAVNDLVGKQDVVVGRHLGVQRCDYPVRTVIVDDNVVNADNLLIAEHQLSNIGDEFGGGRLAEQRADGVQQILIPPMRTANAMSTPR